MSADRVVVTLRDGTAYTFTPTPGKITVEDARNLLIDCMKGVSPFTTMTDPDTGWVVKICSDEIRSVR